SVDPSSPGWRYYWYRDEESSEALTSQDAVFQSEGQISVSQEGNYWCRGGRGTPVYYTKFSDPVSIYTAVSNRPAVTLHPNWPQIYRGEKITVRCEIHGETLSGNPRPAASLTESRTNKERGTQERSSGPNPSQSTKYCATTAPPPPNVQQAANSKRWVIVDEQGGWRGHGRRAERALGAGIRRRVRQSPVAVCCTPQRSSDPPPDSMSPLRCIWMEGTATARLLDEPKSQLRADIRVIPVGGRVTLTCSVDPSSPGWRYYWYRDEESSEALTSQDAVFQSEGQISVSQEGNYWCRGGRGTPVYYTKSSDPVNIYTAVSNRPAVTLHPNWPQIYRGEKITVRCEIHGGDAEWEYEWTTSSSNKPPNLKEFTIDSLSSSNTGTYKCKSRNERKHISTDWSDSFSLTISETSPPVLTVSPSWLSPGASVTLSCEVKHPSAGWSFYWYKALPQLSNFSYIYELLPGSTNGTLQDSYIIDGQTHTAGYACRAGRGDPVIFTLYSQTKMVWSAGQFLDLFMVFPLC
ncbi:uncharacterized protein FYW49_013287, partial [Xenentodon cancila]